MKRHITPLNIIFFLEIIVVVLASLGLVSREAVLVWTGLAVFYMIFSPPEDGLWLVIASIPLFVALPLGENFDTMANWRVLVAVLFCCLFFKRGISFNLAKKEDRLELKENLKHYYGLDVLVLAFLAWGLFSLVAAEYPVLVIKKFLFLVNVSFLFLIVRNLARSKEGIIRVWRAVATGGAVVLAVAALQALAVLVVPLASFWQFWADKVSRVFYGDALAHLLSFANTWFAYYENNPPTLRLFSVFPDSHSFALFCVLLVPIFLGLAFHFQNQRGRYRFYWFLAALALGGVAMSGSRGAWVAAVPPIIAAVYFYLRKKDSAFLKKIFVSLALFVVLFAASSLLWPPTLYVFEAWQEGRGLGAAFSFFERARSISDFDEISNKGRLEIWQKTFSSIAQRPLLGVGWGNYAEVLDEDVSVAKKGASAHSLYLDVAAEIGIPGALILIVLFGNIFYAAWLVWRSQAEPLFRFFGLVFGVYLIWVVGYGLFDVVLLNDKVLLLFMVSLATLFGLRNLIFNPEKLSRSEK
ncbi:MAG: O-antigen ligase family protein [Candidatus Portnoybacteria bacterium]|nr:O-antigen ligase family protein [Candidatus Portnoybacteria bacterium]